MSACRRWCFALLTFALAHLSCKSAGGSSALREGGVEAAGPSQRCIFDPERPAWTYVDFACGDVRAPFQLTYSCAEQILRVSFVDPPGTDLLGCKVTDEGGGLTLCESAASTVTIKYATEGAKLDPVTGRWVKPLAYWVEAWRQFGSSPAARIGAQMCDTGHVLQ